MLKGKLTYTSLGVIAATIVGQYLGIEIAESDLAALTQAGAVIAGIYGRWRATR